MAETDQQEVLREGLIKLGNRAIPMLEEFFDGKRELSDKVEQALKVLQFAVKTTHLEQLKEHITRGQALRLMTFLTQEQREEYIKLTHPEVKAIMPSRPGEKKARSGGT